MFGELISGIVKAATTPTAIVKDVVDTATGKEADNTKKHIKSAGKDFSKVLKDIDNNF